jgi:signal transduction histidine kinase
MAASPNLSSAIFPVGRAPTRKARCACRRISLNLQLNGLGRWRPAAARVSRDRQGHDYGNVVGGQRLAHTVAPVVAPGQFPIPRPPRRSTARAARPARHRRPRRTRRHLGRRLPARPVGPEAGRPLPRPDRADRPRQRRRPRRRRRPARGCRAARRRSHPARAAALNTVLAAPLGERDFVRDASHELRKPLTLLTARTQSALRNAPLRSTRPSCARSRPILTG